MDGAPKMNDILETLAQGRDLDDRAASEGFARLFAGDLTPAQSGAFLMGLRAKGETAAEIAAGVKEALGRARLVPRAPGQSIDTCGTGGDHSSSFNCSTAVALFLAGMGHAVVKHGNRSITSNSGSADVVEALGLPLALEPDQAPMELARRNFAFLFAPQFHPAFKHIMPVRKELGIRTLFNLMGPLLNPARPTHQLLGVAKPEIMRLMAEVLRLTGIERAAVVHGAGGFDELTPFGPAKVIWVDQNGLEEGEINPTDLGIPACEPADVAVGTKEEAVAVLREIIAGKGPAPMRDMVVLNLGCALSLLTGEDLKDGVAQAREAVDKGVAANVLEGVEG